MARPKTKSSLVDGIAELVGSLRNIESKLAMLLHFQKKNTKRRGRGRPPGTTGKSKTGKKSGRGPGRPPGAKNKKSSGKQSSVKSTGRPGRPAKRRVGRPSGSKNKK